MRPKNNIELAKGFEIVLVRGKKKYLFLKINEYKIMNQ